MGASKLDKISIMYDVFIALGLVLPLLSLIFGGLDSLLADFDIDLDGDGDLGPIPVNLNCFVFSLTVLGCTSKILDYLGYYKYISLIIGVILAIIIYFVIYNLIIVPLKKSNPVAAKIEDLISKNVRVITTIPIDGIGEIIYTDATGSKITYLAKYRFGDFEEHKNIKIDSIVKVVGHEDNTLIVERTN